MPLISGGYTISTVCSLDFAAVNRHDALDGIAVRKVLWAVNDAALCRDITVINFNNFSNFRLLMQKSRMLRLKKFRILYHLRDQKKV